MSTMILPRDALNAIAKATKLYHYPRHDTVFDTESLSPHVPVLQAVAKAKHVGAGLMRVEAEPAQFEAWFAHMRARRITNTSAMGDAIIALRVSLVLFEEQAA